MGKKGKALQVLSQIISISEQISSGYPKAKFLVDIAKKYLIIGEKDKAFEMADQAIEAVKTQKDKRYEAEILSKIVVAYVETGYQDKALKMISQAIEDTKEIPNDYIKAVVLSIIASAYSEAGLNDRALEIITLMEESFPGLKTMEERLKTAKLEYIGNEHPIYADSVLNADLRINNECYSPAQKTIYSKLFLERADSGEYDKALKIIDEVYEYPSEKASAFMELAVRYAKNGQKEKASQLLSIALETLCTDGEVFLYPYALIEIAKKYSEYKINPDDNARMILHEIIRKAAQEN